MLESTSCCAGPLPVGDMGPCPVYLVSVEAYASAHNILSRGALHCPQRSIRPQRVGPNQLPSLRPSPQVCLLEQHQSAKQLEGTCTRMSLERLRTRTNVTLLHWTIDDGFVQEPKRASRRALRWRCGGTSWKCWNPISISLHLIRISCTEIARERCKRGRQTCGEPQNPKCVSKPQGAVHAHADAESPKGCSVAS